jgi:hypothetical protein
MLLVVRATLRSLHLPCYGVNLLGSSPHYLFGSTGTEGCVGTGPGYFPPRAGKVTKQM